MSIPNLEGRAYIFQASPTEVPPESRASTIAPGIRMYGKIVGKFLEFFGFAVKSEVLSEACHKTRYVSKEDWRNFISSPHFERILRPLSRSTVRDTFEPREQIGQEPPISPKPEVELYDRRAWSSPDRIDRFIRANSTKINQDMSTDSLNEAVRLAADARFQPPVPIAKSITAGRMYDAAEPAMNIFSKILDVVGSFFRR